MSGTRRSDSQDLGPQFNNSNAHTSWYPPQTWGRCFEYDYHSYTVEQASVSMGNEVTWQGIGHDICPTTSRKRRLSSNGDGNDHRRPSPSIGSYESTSAGAPSASSTSTFETLMDIQSIGGAFGDGGNLFNTYDLPQQDDTLYWHAHDGDDLLASSDFPSVVATAADYESSTVGAAEYDEYTTGYSDLLADLTPPPPLTRPNNGPAAVATGRPLSRDGTASSNSNDVAYAQSTVIKLQNRKEEEVKVEAPPSPSLGAQPSQLTPASPSSGRPRRCTGSDASSEGANDFNTRPALTEANLEKLNDISEFLHNPKYTNLMVEYSPKITFPLGEGGRELLRACLNVKGCKGRQLQGASVPQLLELAHNWGLWNVAIRIKVERTVSELCSFHDKFVKFKANQSQQRKYVKKEYMVLQRGADGKIEKILYDKDRKITLGKEGREQLRAQLRRLHDQIPGEMDALLQKHGFKYSELRNATVQQLSQMAFVCQLWHQVVHACRKQEEKRDTKKECVASTGEDEGYPPLPRSLNPLIGDDLPPQELPALSMLLQQSSVEPPGIDQHLPPLHHHHHCEEALTSSDLLSVPHDLDDPGIHESFFGRPPDDDDIPVRLDAPCVKQERLDEDCPTTTNALLEAEPLQESPFPNTEEPEVPSTNTPPLSPTISPATADFLRRRPSLCGYVDGFSPEFQEAFARFIGMLPEGGELQIQDVFAQFLSSHDIFRGALPPLI